MTATTKYFLVSLPLQSTVNATWSSLQRGISSVAYDTRAYRFHIPELRVGTLDTLLALGDELAKVLRPTTCIRVHLLHILKQKELVQVNVYVEGVTHKIRRHIEELEHAAGSQTASLSVDGVPVDVVITRFSWNEARYPLESPLKDTVHFIQEIVAKLEDDLKVRVGEYANIKTQLSTTLRKQTGRLGGDNTNLKDSMAVRDLSTLVNAEDIISTAHLVTLVVVIPKYSQKEWLKTYETLTELVVPRSSKKLQEDNEYALYTVTLFRNAAESFTDAARDKGFQVRDVKFDPLGQQHFREEAEHLQQEQSNLRHSLQHWCYASFSEVFSAWLHLCSIRIFTESILRYGLPPAFLAAVLAPTARNEIKVRSVLDELCGGLNSGCSKFWKGNDDPAMAGLAGGDCEVHPYVSFTINLSS